MLPTQIDEVSIRFVIEIATVNLLALSFEIFVSRRVSLSLGSLASGIYLQFSSLFPSLVSATMATHPTDSEQALRKLEDQLTCGICLDSYTALNCCSVSMCIANSVWSNL